MKFTLWMLYTGGPKKWKAYQTAEECTRDETALNATRLIPFTCAENDANFFRFILEFFAGCGSLFGGWLLALACALAALAWADYVCTTAPRVAWGRMIWPLLLLSGVCFCVNMLASIAIYIFY